MLEINKVNTFYGDFQALKDVTLQVNDNELVALLGPNGHGKSTLLKTICGLLSAASGSIKFNTKEIAKLSVQNIVEMGVVYIAEERHLFPEMTVLENLKLGAYNTNARKKEAESLHYVFQLFPRLNEWRNRLASTLSGGEARMLALGRGLMSCAKFLAIDEPSIGLAPHLRADVFKQIGEIKKSGVSILLVEQSISESTEIADRVYFMEDGRIIFEGDKEAVLDNKDVREAFLGV